MVSTPTDGTAGRRRLGGRVRRLFQTERVEVRFLVVMIHPLPPFEVIYDGVSQRSGRSLEERFKKPLGDDQAA